MRKDTAILVVGFGSIGQRRYRNLCSLGFTNIAVYDIDAAKVARAGARLLKYFDQKTCSEFSLVFVCNPTTLHMAAAIVAAKAGCDLFIEKPLSHSQAGIALLTRALKKGNRIAVVACNNRFHLGFIRLERLVASHRLGKPLTAEAVFTRDLMRLGPAYKKSYAAQKVGGGVLLDLGPHVMEYCSTLFGAIRSVLAYKTKRTALLIAAEDFIAGAMIHRSGVVTTFSFDYFRKPKEHKLTVHFEAGLAEVDFARGTFMWSEGKKIRTERLYKSLSGEDARDDMYLKELTYALRCFDRKAKPLYDLERATKVVSVLQSIHTAARRGTHISL